MTLTPRKPLQLLGVLWQYLLIALDFIMTCEPIDIIYSTLGTGNFEFKCYERSYGILARTFGAVLHSM